VLLHCLLVPYGPPHYGIGYALYQLLGGCAPWPGEKRWVLICFVSVCVGYGLRRHLCCPQLGCGSGPSSNVGGWSPVPVAIQRRLSSLFGGGLQRFNAFRRLPRPLWWVPVGGPSECYPVVGYCVHRPRWGASTFSLLERATLSWNIHRFQPAFSCQKEVPRRLVV
jgi:hypothetical protein